MSKLKNTSSSKKHSPLTATSLIVGIVIGIGIFFKIGDVMKAVEGENNLAIIAWIVGALLILLGALSVAGLATTTDENGGLQNYIEKTWGKSLSFVVGFFQTFIFFPTLIAGVSFYASEFTVNLFDKSMDSGDWKLVSLVAFAYMLIFGVSNLLTSKGAIIQKVSTFIKIIPIIGVIIAGLFFASNVSGDLPVFDSITRSNKSDFMLVGAALIPILFAFDGWIIVTTMSNEIENSKKVLPIAIVSAMGFVGFVYVLFNVALLNIAPGNAYANGLSLFEVLKVMLGEKAGNLLSIFIVISALGVINGLFMASFRAPQAFFDKFEFGGMLEKFENKIKTNIVSSGIFVITLSVIFALIPIIGELTEQGTIGTYISLLTDGPVTFMWIIYIILFVGIAVLTISKKIDINIWFSVTSIIAAIVGLYAVLSKLTSEPLYTSLTLVIFVVALCFETKVKVK